MNKQQEIYAIVGGGITGLSYARYLQKRKAHFFMVDSRPNPPLMSQWQREFPEITTFTGEFNERSFATATALLMSPGVSINETVLQSMTKKGIPIIGELDMFSQEKLGNIIQITGTNGKSTVTSMVADMSSGSGIKTAVGGNLGTPMLDLLEEQADSYILELSSFQLEQAKHFHSDVSAFLNFAPDHLERHKDMEDYHQAKLKIFNNAECVVVNRGQNDTFPGATHKGQKVYSFGLDGGSSEGQVGIVKHAGRDWFSNGKPVLPVDELALSGAGAYENALAAIAIASAAKISERAMIATLRHFKGLPHRGTESIKTINNVSFFDNSKATNVAAASKAIFAVNRARERKVVLIAGGQNKYLDFNPLRGPMHYCGRAAVLLGETKFEIAQVLENIVPTICVGDMENAVKEAYHLARPQSDTVLLAPACTSLDMFASFEQRGKSFTDAVGGLC